MAMYKEIKKDYNRLDSIISSWYEELCRQGGLCVAISRKAPRLLEWCANRFGHSDGMEVITEIALPFVDFSRRESCILTDEAIYNGTTFSKVYDLIKGIAPMTMVKPKPLVVAENAHFNINDEVNIIKEDEICFFVDTIIKRFHEGIKPYDIEYPLIYLDLGHEIKDEEMIAALELFSALENTRTGNSCDEVYYVTETYSRETGKAMKSYSYIFEYMFKDYLPNYLKPDFAKLRMNVKGNILSIAVMSPYVLTDNDIENPEMIFSGAFSDIWRNICDAVINHNDENKEYEYQRRKSLTILANYLLSYNNYLALKENIMMAFVAKRSWIDEHDIAYLTGRELASAVKDALVSITAPIEVTRLYPLSSDIDKSYMPAAYKEEYIRKVGAANLKAQHFFEKISNQFSTMHWDIEVNSRKNSPDDYYSRLRFGESFSSLYERYKYNSNILRFDIHRNIDSRVDAGSVVPNFVRLENTPDYWLRLFRSGENEDLQIDQFNRVMLNLFRQYQKVSNDQTLPYLVVQLVLTLMAYMDKNSYSRFFGYKIGIDDSEAISSPFIIVDYKSIDILDKMARSRMFGTNGKNAFTLLNAESYSKYDTGNPLSAQQESDMAEAVEFVHNLCADYVAWDVIKALYLFNLLKFDVSKFGHDVEALADDFRKDVEAGISTNTQDHINRFIKLLTLIPSEENVVENMPESHWRTVFLDLYNKYMGNISVVRNLQHRLNRILYLNCYWGLKTTGKMNGYVADFIHNNELDKYFSPEEEEKLKNSASMTVEDFKRYVLNML